MKRLYLLRHSKAGQTNKKLLDDHERDLTEKGIALCETFGEYFSKLQKPALVMCSTAERAKETAKLVMESAGFQPEFQYTSKLYLASPDELYNIVRALPDDVNSILLVGHNPGMQFFAVSLAGKGDKKTFREMRNHFPPPSLVAFDLDIESWGLVEPQAGILVDFQSSKTI